MFDRLRPRGIVYSRILYVLAAIGLVKLVNWLLPEDNLLSMAAFVFATVTAIVCCIDILNANIIANANAKKHGSNNEL